MPAIEAAALTKSYRARQQTVRALDGFDLRVEAGQVQAVLGPNGAGKTTAVKCLTTLAVVDSGEARIAGIDIRGRPADVRRTIGLVAQKATADPAATGRENLVLAARLQGLNRSDAADRASQLLQRFGLGDAADRQAKTYSGGMARKLDVAVGLVHRPAVLFLDEPTTGLDPEARADMWAEIARISGDEKITVLLTTHYLEEADRLADRVAIVDAGRVVVEGTPEELKNDLSGDTIEIALDSAGAAEIGAGALRGTSGLRGVEVVGRHIRARADAGVNLIPTLLSILDTHDLTTESVSVARPTLDDVYLHHVGRSFEEVA